MTDIPVNTYIEWTDLNRKIGKCPVPDGSDVTVWLSDGAVDRDSIPQSWRWNDSTIFITAYLVHELAWEPVAVWAVIEGTILPRAAFDCPHAAKNWAEIHGGRVVKLVEVDDD